MRKLTIYILINCLTVQLLVGCYSANYMTLNELKEFDDNNEIIITTTDSTEYTLKRDSTSQYYSNWQFVDDNIEWTKTKLVFKKDNPSRGKYTRTNGIIEENEILKIEIEELDVLNTTLLSLGIIVGAVLIIGLLTFELDLKLGK